MPFYYFQPYRTRTCRSPMWIHNLQNKLFQVGQEIRCTSQWLLGNKSWGTAWVLQRGPKVSQTRNHVTLCCSNLKLRVHTQQTASLHSLTSYLFVKSCSNKYTTDTNFLILQSINYSANDKFFQSRVLPYCNFIISCIDIS